MPSSRARACPLYLFTLAVFWSNCTALEAQDSAEAESLFKKMAEKVVGAKSLTIICSGQFKTAGFEAKVNASLLMKEGNKMKMELDVSGFRDAQPYSHAVRIISNGTTFKMQEDKGEWVEYATTKKWNELIALNVSRGGFPSGLELVRLKKEGENQDSAMGFRPVALPAEYVLCKKDLVGRREAVPIEFKIKGEAEFLKDISTILWLDPDNGLPLKRLNVIRTERTLTVTETYEKFAINEPLDDSSFLLPKE